jgi:beta-N-acetylhexosaminidase
VGLLDEQQPEVTVTEEEKRNYERHSLEIGEHSVCMVRNEDGAIPVKLKPGAKVLTVSVQLDQKVRGVTQALDTVDEELRKRGYEVDNLVNPFGYHLSEISHEYEAVFVNLHIPPRYGTTALAGGTAMVLWRAFWTSHPQVVFTSFGDPYKIYEMPYVPNMLNCFSNSPSSQKAAVKVWMGEMEAKGKSPVSLEGFFEAKVK